MKINKIAIKLGIAITLLLLVVLLPLGYVIDQIFSGFYYGQVQDDIDQQASHYASALSDSENRMMMEMIEMMSEFSQVKLYIVDTEGEIIANAGVPELPKGSFISEEELNILSVGNAIELEYESSTTGSRYLVSGQPIHDEETFYGGVYVLSSAEIVYKSIQQVRQMLVLSGIGTFFLALGFTLVLSRKLSKPLVQMEQATRKIAKGDLDTRVKVITGDETSSLAQAINDLAIDLKMYRNTRREFFASISHELRTPMTYLEGYTKILRERLYESEAEKEQYLDIIHQESMRLTHLIHDLFELSIMEEGKYSLNQEWIDLGEVMENINHKVSLKAKEKGIIFNFTIEEEVPLVFGDGHRMEQIFSNLLENAIRYTDQGKIHVKIKNLQQYGILIAIRDTGKGIPKEELPHIFERFYRVEKSRSREHGGTGLGLAIVKQLVELQGGTIQVFSEEKNGTRFEIRFPTIPMNGGEKQ